MSARKVSILLAICLIAAIPLVLQIGVAAGGPKYTLTTQVSGCGSVEPASGSYKPNTWLLMTAYPCTGWLFDHWTANVFLESATANPTHITMQDNALVTAYFVEDPNPPTPTPIPPTPTPGPSPTPVPLQAFYDDFNYTDSSDPAIAAFGWWVRTGTGGPGPRKATWSADNVTFLDDPNTPGNRLMQLAATTTGSRGIISQAEMEGPISTTLGTWGARVWLSDAPVSGPDGDQVVETFFTIADYSLANQPEYCELDHEYLPNGGWGVSGPTMWNTSYDTASSSTSSHRSGSLAGWHTLLIVAMNGEVKYYVDGVIYATHGGVYYPDGVMCPDFNLWFIDRGFVASTTSRTYTEQVDWVYYVKDQSLSTAQVEEAVASLRGQGIVRQNTLP